MTRKLVSVKVALLTMLVVGTSQAFGEQAATVATPVSLTNASAQFASMQAELDSLRAQIDMVSHGGAQKGGCDECGKDGCGKCAAACGCNCFCDLGCGGLYGGVEAVIVRPHRSDETDVVGLGGVGAFDPRFDYEASPRIFLGWRNSEGTGIRARYWYFDQVSETLADFPGLTGINPDFYNSRLKVQALDVEFTQMVCWGPLNSNLALGVRYGSVEDRLQGFDDAGLTAFAGDLRTQFDGFGPTIAMENRIPIGCTNFAAVGNFRGSLLFGDMHYTIADDTGARATVTDGLDDVVAVAEIQVGIEWAREVRFGRLSAYALLEGQWWSGATSNLALDAVTFPIGGIVNGFSTDQDLGFIGGTFGVQLAR